MKTARLTPRAGLRVTALLAFTLLVFAVAVDFPPAGKVAMVAAFLVNLAVGHRYYLATRRRQR